MNEILVKDNIFIRPSSELERESLISMGFIPHVTEEKSSPKKTPTKPKAPAKKQEKEAK
ncbi:hypothetical protein OCD65_28075 [Bacillus paranthracis]|uniref:hypothetical protein n=1 Tax=Bacillus paranthracis TaxID=2026186 RepID=UPI0021D267CB|nr:hypothetical protein [Bacillus paranthracis]MCU5020540.1 hypothetical protein [Bacillus paranthracis]